jgi:DNA helicase II / ATP-dependent DNA helicase PcrA
LTASAANTRARILRQPDKHTKTEHTVRDRLNQFLKTLNPQQRDAVVAPEGPTLVLAGAGSGKTRVLTGRAFYLMAHHHVSPQAMVVMTFTNKAAEELRTRLKSYLGEKPEVPWAGTFHAFCARLLRLYGEEIGLTRSFSIYDTGDTEQALAAILADRRIVRDELAPALLRSWISLMKNGGTLGGKHPFRRLAYELLEEYNDRLQRANAVDFDDLLRLPVELFKSKPEVLDRLQKRYDHVLIDEFQDTNRHQYELAQMLASPQNNLFVVGDDDQSIYGWRGADYRNVFAFQKDLPGARVYRLEQNYRSTQPILDVANDVIACNEKREDKKLWTENKTGEKVVLRQLSRSVDEALEVVGEMVHLVKSGKHRWSDFAVLFRTNALSRPFEETLVSQAIPYSVVGGVRFYERKEIKDLIAYLRVMVNANDDQAWRRALKTPPRGIGEVTVQQLDEAARKRGITLGGVMASLEDSEDLSSLARNKLRPFAERMTAIRTEIAGKSLVEAVEAVFLASGLREYYEEQDAEQSGERIDNLTQLMEAARDRMKEHPGYDLTDFLSEVALVSDIDDYQESSERVTLMTMHSAKGLEFPVVFIVGVEEKILPHQRSMNSSSELEEERRLFYVGITRARERLYLSYAQTRYINGLLEFQEPSRFLRDINPLHLRGWSLPGRTREVTEYDESGEFMQRPEAPIKRRSRSSAPPPVSNLIPYKIGDLVKHPEFGLGVVTAKSGDIENLKIRVAFEGMGSKLLAVKYAPLTKVED